MFHPTGQPLFSRLGWALRQSPELWARWVSGSTEWVGLAVVLSFEESLFSMSLLEVHHGFQVTVLMFCLEFGIVVGGGIWALG